MKKLNEFNDAEGSYDAGPASDPPKSPLECARMIARKLHDVVKSEDLTFEEKRNAIYEIVQDEICSTEEHYVTEFNIQLRMLPLYQTTMGWAKSQGLDDVITDALSFDPFTEDYNMDIKRLQELAGLSVTEGPEMVFGLSGEMDHGDEAPTGQEVQQVDAFDVRDFEDKLLGHYPEFTSQSDGAGNYTFDFQGEQVAEFSENDRTGSILIPAVHEDTMQNGYDNVKQHDEPRGYFDRWTSDGATGTPPRSVGPAGAKHGDNPMFAKMRAESLDSKEIHKKLVYEYRSFKKKVIKENVTLDQGFLSKVKPAIERTYNLIGADLEQAMDFTDASADNESIIEACLDADRLNYAGREGQEAYNLLRLAYDQYGYNVVLKFLSRNIQLV